MPLVERLRRWLAVIAVVFSLFVAGAYVRGRLRQTTTARPIPLKIDSQLKRTASGFEYAKSEGGRTIFRIRAGEVKEFKLNGRTALRKVSILLYGRDSSRFDRIYGDDFAYDPQSGDITADGDVQIDLEANPAGLLTPDQTPPADLKNPIHLKMRGLVFNKNTGNAYSNGRAEFTSAQGSGWAQGVRYEASSRTLTLTSQIHAVVAGPNASVLTAARGTVSGDPRQLQLEQPRIERGGSVLQAAAATFIFGPDNHMARIVANGAVHAETAQKTAQPQSATGALPSHSTVNAQRAEFVLNDAGDQLHSGLLTGHVQMDQSGPQPMQANAERVQMEFSARGVLERVKAEAQARVHYGPAEDQNSLKPDVTNAGGRGEDYEITAQAIDFDVGGGSHLDRATTSGPAQITLLNTNGGQQEKPAQKTLITAGHFESKFAKSARASMRLVSVHGEPDVKIVSAAPGQPERASTSQSVDAEFSPEGQLTAVTQSGTFHYFGGEGAGRRLEAFSSQARYTMGDQLVTLTGSPRLAGENMTTTAQTVRINRISGEAFAQGDVKSTYTPQSTSQANPGGGALLGSRAPIHVTASAMKAKSSPNLAVYTGNARLWQDANMIEAPEIEFDNARRTVRAKGNTASPATMTVAQNDKATKSTPVRLSGMTLTYTDSDQTATYEGGVTATGQDFTAMAKTMTLVLAPTIQVKENKTVAGSNRVERMVASGAVNIEQAGRKATGEQLVYTPADDKFVLTGGPPCIFDAERGKITGDSLTFYRHDARVLVEGEANSPVVTQTQVAR